MKNDLVALLVKKLSLNSEALANQFKDSANEVGVRYLIIDDVLPDDICHEIYRQFPSLDAMRYMSSFRERKYTSKAFDSFDSILSDITFALQDIEVLKLVEAITNISDQTADPTLYAGGLSAMSNNSFLSPHIDNSHNVDRDKYRTLNLLYYVTPDWKYEYGGNLQLWDCGLKNNVTIHSKFNRLVMMETNPSSWHGVNKVIVDRTRCCVSNYYFSPNSPTGHDYYNVTGFSAPWSEPLRRLIGKLDSLGRNCIRAVFPSGLGEKDIYRPKGPHE